MTCRHESSKWVAFNPDGGNVALDDNSEGEVAHYANVEWCSECGSVKIGEEWILPGHSEPPWLTVIKSLGSIAIDIEVWTKDGGNHLDTRQIDQLALAVDHVNRARGFLDRAFGVQTADTLKPIANAEAE